MTRLNEMYKLQARLQQRIGLNPPGYDIFDKERMTKEFCLAIVHEVGEVLEGINWKHWKTTYENPDENYLKREFVDLLHFVFNLFLTWGFTADDIYEEYTSKHKENMRRQDEAY